MLWVARACWLVLAFTNGVAIDEALHGASGASRTAVAVLGYTLWGAALVALLAPRPAGFTLLRVAVTTAVATALWSAWEAPARASLPALTVALAAATTVTSAAVARASAQGSAYGYEARFPLRAPFALLAGGIPIVAGLAAAAAAAGPLLLAAGAPLAGLPVTVAGVPVAVALVRALHHLERRMLVLVPAGLTLVDPMTLADPVLFPRRSLVSITPAPVHPPRGAVDLRLGTAPGSIALRMREPGPIVRRTGATEGTTVETDTVLCAPVRVRELLDAAAARGLVVPPPRQQGAAQAARAEPSTTSGSDGS